MKFIRLNSIIIGFVFFYGSLSLNAQVKVSKVLQDSEIVETASNKLYFIDFWATWCGPCVYAKKILTVLQKQYPKDFHVVSISEENSSKVEQFIYKRPTPLTIAIDNNGYTFNSFNIKSLPQGILFNAKGEKLWQGHPSDLKPQLLDKFLKETKIRKPLYDFLEVINSTEVLQDDYTPVEDFEIRHSDNRFEVLDISYDSSYLKLDGKLIDILSYLSKISKRQIEISSDLNKNYKVYLKKSELDKNNHSENVLEKLELNFTEQTSQGEVMSLEILNPNFWDTNQINWGDVESRYLISDSDIKADNVSLKELTYELSKALDIPVIITNEDARSYKKHDWQIHYKYFEFMSNNLLDYGISVIKDTSSFPSYTVIKKAP